jgi:hypothetical protein
MEFIFNLGGTPGFYTHNALTRANFMRRARWLASVGYATKKQAEAVRNTRVLEGCGKINSHSLH